MNSRRRVNSTVMCFPFESMIANSIVAMMLALALTQGNTQLPSDFATLRKISIEELQLKNDAHFSVLGRDRIKRWDLNQDDGQLVFSLADGFKARAPAQIIGTYIPADDTWPGAWDIR